MDAFYRNLAEVAAITVSDSILTLNDAIGRGGEPIRTLAAGYPELRRPASEIP